MNGLNSTTKRHRLADWIKKENPSICCLQEIHLISKDARRRKVKRWKKIFQANRNQKRAGVAILISDKIDFNIKLLKETEKGTI